MTDKWVDVKDWSEFEVGQKLKGPSGQDFEVHKVDTYSATMTSGDVLIRGQFSYQLGIGNIWQRLETVATEKEASTGEWVPVKDWVDLKPGIKVTSLPDGEKHIQEIRWDSYRHGLSLTIKYADGTSHLIANTAMDPQDPYLRFYSWQETPKQTNKYQTLEKVFSQPEPEYKPKKIDDYPHTCHHCGSKSFNGEYYIDCSGKCAKSQA
jgi:hypothetical protein